MRAALSVLVATLALVATPTSGAAQQSAAVFDFEFLDSSLEGELKGVRADEQARVADISRQLRARIAESGRFALVDIAPVAAQARASNLQACGACDVRLAGQVGAELAITGTVQKISNLILNMNIYIREVATGKLIGAMSANMRGNTEESWSRTLDWLVRNRLLTPDFGARR